MARPVDIIGHRGARGLFPENTIEGFRQAIALGVRYFELDTGVTADGVAVVHHDPHLNPNLARDAQGAWIEEPPPAIHDLTFQALRTYDVGRIRPGTVYRMLYRQQKGMDGARIPTLEDVLRACPDARFIVELKTDPSRPHVTVPPETMAEIVLSAIDAADAADRVIVESFDWRGPRHIRRIRPSMPLAWLTRDASSADIELWRGAASVKASCPAAIAAEGGGIWAPAWETLTHAAVQEAHQLGSPVVPWTVNRRLSMRRLIDWGVDGLITDRPDRALLEVRR